MITAEKRGLSELDRRLHELVASVADWNIYKDFQPVDITAQGMILMWMRDTPFPSALLRISDDEKMISINFDVG